MPHQHLSQAPLPLTPTNLPTNAPTQFPQTVPGGQWVEDENASMWSGVPDSPIVICNPLSVQ